MDIATAAAQAPDEVLHALGSGAGGLTDDEARRRLADAGPNVLRVHRARALPVLWRQLKSPLLLLLAVTAALSGILGDRTDAIIIGVILLASVGLGFINEYRAERSAAALHEQVRHRAIVVRGGRAREVDVADLVPGDVIDLHLGEVVPADVRLLDTAGLACDESVLTGESLPAEKQAAAVPAGTGLGDLTSCALMGTVVQAGSARAVVVATGTRAAFGRIAADLGDHEPETAFQAGLRRFSMLLVQVAAVLTVVVFVINVARHQPVLDALMFSLAIAIGISPQLLPAIVSTSLSAGSRALARRHVLVKRLVCIEDLGDIDVLLTDKTGTLTEGRIAFMRSIGADGSQDAAPAVLGLVASEVTAGSDGAVASGNPLDAALWAGVTAPAERDAAAAYRRLSVLPFDHDRRLVTVLVDSPSGERLLVTKGAPESVFQRAKTVPDAVRAAADREFSAGNRVVAVATRPVPDATAVGPDDERDLEVRGLLVFLDPAKPSARAALARLADLGIAVKVVTGDNAAVAARVCTELGLTLGSGSVLSGQDIDAADDDALAGLVREARVFARVSPEHKARIVRAERRGGAVVSFLGDGVNDALALHAADVGISVDSGTDVAKDAADVILLEKDLDVLADGVSEGRRIFANTIKYVMMGTSSNLGNMISAAGASAFLTFLPMLPSQILLNNLLYDTSQLTIPTDEVDEEQLRRPSHWDISAIRRFMVVFGPISSIFDILTFIVMLRVFDASPPLFRSGWFVESLATQCMVIFAIRTRRVPFWRSRPSLPLALSAIGVALVGAIIPATPLAGPLGFAPLPGSFYALVVGFVAAYLSIIELAKTWYYRTVPVAGRAPVTPPAQRLARPARTRVRRVHRRASRFGSRPAVGTR
ncbi:MAG TPA: magnesium-translocating P-type ATPase [Kineosporiaceae bacterium]|nr:magnesium-translocating P-type ATPase [Kineosporiaceae bacterium]